LSRLPALPELLLQTSELRDTLQILILLYSSDKNGVFSVNSNVSPLRRLPKGRHLKSPSRHLPYVPPPSTGKPRSKTVGETVFFFLFLFSISPLSPLSILLTSSFPVLFRPFSFLFLPLFGNQT